MLGPRMRPRFTRVVPHVPAHTLEQLRAALEAPDCPYTGSILDRHVRLRIREALKASTDCKQIA